jgi:hypothetical protein
MSIEDSYAFVHNPESNIQGIGIKNGKYHGVIYEYKNVSFDREDFGKQEFGDLLGDILVDVIDKYGTGEQFDSDD